MSVILTSSKKAVMKPKSAKPKKKKKASSSSSAGPSAADQTPPTSTNRTAVWHWELEGKPVTVMLNKDKNDVWCNEQIGDVREGFDAAADGGVLEFELFIADTMHEAKIKRTISGERSEPFRFQLYVDGYMILEHAPRPTYEKDESDLPPYSQDGAYGHGPYFDPQDDEEKKFK